MEVLVSAPVMMSILLCSLSLILQIKHDFTTVIPSFQKVAEWNKVKNKMVAPKCGSFLHLQK